MELIVFFALAGFLAAIIGLTVVYRAGWFFSLAGLLLGMYGMLVLYADSFVLTYYSSGLLVTLSADSGGLMASLFGFLVVLVVLAPMLRGAQG